MEFYDEVRVYFPRLSHTYMCTTCMYVKAVGNKGVIDDKMSSRTFCASVQEVHLSSLLEKTRGPYAARVPLDFAPLSARGGHTNRHSECCPSAQGFWYQRQLLLPERRSDILEQ